MIVVNVTMGFSEDDIASLKPMLSKMEEASRAESGCDDYTFSVEVNNPDVLRITERWHSMDALTEHFKSPHMADFRAAMANFTVKSRQAYFYEASEIDPPG